MINNDYIGTILPNLYVDLVTISDDENYNIFEVNYSFLENLSKEIFSWSDMPLEALQNIKIAFRLLINEDPLFVERIKNLSSGDDKKFLLKDNIDSSINQIFFSNRRESSSQILEDSIFDLVLNANVDPSNALNDRQAQATKELLEAANGNLLKQYKSSILSKISNQIKVPKEVFLEKVELIAFVYYDFTEDDVPDIIGRPVHINLITTQLLDPKINNYTYSDKPTVNYYGPVVYDGKGKIYDDTSYYLDGVGQELTESLIEFNRVLDKRLNKLPSLLSLALPSSRPPVKEKYFSKIFTTVVKNENNLFNFFTAVDQLDLPGRPNFNFQQEFTEPLPAWDSINSYGDVLFKGVFFFDFLRYFKEICSYPFVPVSPEEIFELIKIRIKSVDFAQFDEPIIELINDKNNNYPLAKISFTSKSDTKKIFDNLEKLHRSKKANDFKIPVFLDNMKDLSEINFFKTKNDLINFTNILNQYFTKSGSDRQNFYNNNILNVITKDSLLSIVKVLGIDTSVLISEESIYTIEKIIEIYVKFLNPRYPSVYYPIISYFMNTLNDFFNQIQNSVNKRPLFTFSGETYISGRNTSLKTDVDKQWNMILLNSENFYLTYQNGLIYKKFLIPNEYGPIRQLTPFFKSKNNKDYLNYIEPPLYSSIYLGDRHELSEKNVYYLYSTFFDDVDKIFNVKVTLDNRS